MINTEDKKWVVFQENQYKLNKMGNVVCVCDSKADAELTINSIVYDYEKQGKLVFHLSMDTDFLVASVKVSDDETINYSTFEVPHISTMDIIRTKMLVNMAHYNGERFAVVKYSWSDEVNPDEVYEGIIRIGDSRETPEEIYNQILYDVKDIDELVELTQEGNGSDFLIVDFIEYDDKAIEEYDEVMGNYDDVDDETLLMKLIIAVHKAKTTIYDICEKEGHNPTNLYFCTTLEDVFDIPTTLSEHSALLQTLKSECKQIPTDDCAYIDLYDDGEYVDIAIDIVRNSKGHIIDFKA